MKYGMWATQGQSIFIEATVSNFGTSEMWFTASEDQKQSRSSAVNTNYSVAQFAGKLGDKNVNPHPDGWKWMTTICSIIPATLSRFAGTHLPWDVQFGVHE